MVSVGLFYTALGLLLLVFGFRYLETAELGEGGKYFARVRVGIDAGAAALYAFLVRYVSLDALVAAAVRAYAVTQYYTARVLARLAHMLEHRARRMVHRSAKRARTGYYLENIKLREVEK